MKTKSLLRIWHKELKIFEIKIIKIEIQRQDREESLYKTDKMKKKIN